MCDLIWLTDAQMRRIEPYFPLSHGVPRVDDRRIISGIIFVIRNGLKHQPALPYQQAYAFVQALREKRGISPKAFEFLILTAARSGEVLGAKWQEVDLATKVWTIPAERMKAGREHRMVRRRPACATGRHSCPRDGQ